MKSLLSIRRRPVRAALLLALALCAAPAAAAAQGSPPGPAPTPNPLDVRQGGSIPAPLAVREGSAAAALILAPGTPPLTQRTADNLAAFFEWLLDAPLTQGQRQDLQDEAVAAWMGDHVDTMRSILQLERDFGQVAQLGETQRMQVRDALQASVLADARRQPDDPLSRWMLAIYDAAHMPIAPGAPPLTRQVAEAYAEVQYFLLSVVGTGESRRIDQDFGPLGRDAWVRAIAADYPGYSPEQQRQLAQMPLFRAAIGEAWPALPDPERARLRDQWRPVVQSLLDQATCETFGTLMAVGLVERTDANRTHDTSCHPPATAPDRPALPLAQGRPEDFRLTEADVQVNPNAYTFLSNLQVTQHVGTMNMLSIMGGSPYRYTTTYKR